MPKKIKKITTRTKKREKPKAARSRPAGRSTGAEARNASPTAGVVEAPEKAVCPIVGMGASAGGLEAFEHFFTHMPSNSGLAFVLVLHLDPTAKSLLVELLARNTKMPVCRAEQGMKVEPDHVYITPPGAALTIQRGVLQVLAQKEPRRPPLPVDTFLRSLAEDRGENAMAVILSGSGSDGTLGVKAVKEQGGMTMVQEERTAKHDDMPRNAIATGQVDYILPVDAMPQTLIDYVRHMRVLRRPKKDRARADEPDAHLPKIFLLLRNKTGHDFTHYKQNTVMRRVERRMQLLQIERVSEYVKRLRQSAGEIEALFKDLLIAVTHFFRDPEAFVSLSAKVIPPMFVQRQGDEPIRVWVPGCATGEEAYSIGILLAEHMNMVGTNVPVQIFATDIDGSTLEFARAGVYPESIVADVSSERLDRFFVHEGDTYRGAKQLREMTVFSVHNLIKDPPFRKLDLISCRNVLIYLGPELQKRLLPLFHYALKPAGALFLGPSETISACPELFSTLDKHYRIFRRRSVATRPLPEFPLFPVERLAPERGELTPRVPAAEISVAKATERMLLADFAPACVIVNEKYDVVHFHGRTGRYLEAPPGAPDVNIIRMARPGLRVELRTALHRAVSEHCTVVRENVQVRSNGGSQPINLVVRPVTEPGCGPALLMVVFEDIRPRQIIAEPPTRAAPLTTSEEAAVRQLESELRSTKEHLQTTIEELETSNQELKSSNEELLSMNEELQSANQELETSKEELQSVNEELETVNAELNSKVEQLDRANSDIRNLLASTQIATIFLGNDLCIKSFTPAISDVFRLIPGDVGRPITDIARRIAYEGLPGDVQDVLRTLSMVEHEVQAQDGHWYIMRILPYRTIDNVIDGVVITFVDITERKRAADAVQEAREYAESVVGTVREPLIVLDAGLRVVSANRSFYETFQATPEETRGRLLYDLGNRQWDIPRLRTLLEDILPEKTTLEDFEVEHDFPTIGRRVMLLNARRLYREASETRLVLLCIEDTTERKRAEEALRRANAELEQRNAEMEQFVFTASHDLKSPLVSIHGFASHLARDFDQGRTDRLQEFVGEIRSSADEMKHLIDDLLELSRIGRVTSPPKPVAMTKLMRGVAKKHAGRLAERSVALEIQPDMPTVSVDQARMAQVFDNLFVNALTHSGAVPDLQIAIGAREAENEIRFFVRDNGAGIAEELHDKVFELFRRLNPDGEGTGVGLTIVKRIVEFHGGRVWVESQPGAGATFWVALPLERVAVPQQ
jgi:two-component system CheB/CheR fusion protein